MRPRFVQALILFTLVVPLEAQSTEEAQVLGAMVEFVLDSTAVAASGHFLNQPEIETFCVFPGLENERLHPETIDLLEKRLYFEFSRRTPARECIPGADHRSYFDPDGRRAVQVYVRARIMAPDSAVASFGIDLGPLGGSKAEVCSFIRSGDHWVRLPSTCHTVQS